MRVRCPNCASTSEAGWPIVLAVCTCGKVLRFPLLGEANNSSDLGRNAVVDYYEILGLRREATSAEIRTAHRQRARETHPDLGGDREEFQIVQIAYEVLIKPSSRTEYDSELKRKSLSGDSHGAPDLVGMTIDDAAAAGRNAGLSLQMVIVQVGRGSPLRGRVIGQFPNPGEPVSLSLGILVGIDSMSSLWERFLTGLSEVSGGFWLGLKSSGNVYWQMKSPVQLGSGSTSQTLAEQAGRATGVVALDVASAAANTAVFALKFFLFAGLSFGMLLSLALLVVAPPIGLFAGVVVVAATVGIRKKLRNL